LAFPLHGIQASIDPTHPLFGEVDALARYSVCSFPFLRGSEVNWVTFGGNAAEFRDCIDTLRAWLMPQYASEELNSIVSPAVASGALASLIVAVSAHGYFRWKSTASGLDRVAARLAQIRTLERRRPKGRTTKRVSLQELRSEFQAAYATANWEAAEHAIDQIDKLELDTALNAEQMRVQLWGGLAEYERLIQRTESRRLLELNITERVRRLILEAYAVVELRALEDSGRYKDAATRYRESLHAKLADSIVAVSEIDTNQLQRLAAYRAWVDEDTDALFDEGLPAEDAVVSRLRGLTGSHEAAASVAAAKNDSATSWKDLVVLVVAERDEFVEECLDRICTLPQLHRREEAEACTHALLQLFTDDQVSTRAAAKKIRHQVLMRLVDTALCDAEFPGVDLEDLYAEILEIWVLEHGDSSFPPYGQLTLGLSEGLLELSARHEALVIRSIQTWWHQRPAGARLSWLLEAIDLLSLHLTDVSEVHKLWIEGAQLIRRDRRVVAGGESSLWRQLGLRLELPEPTIREFLGSETVGISREDVLASAGLRRIAIVTLQERAGRVARDMLANRTKAEVILVTSTVADSATKMAAESDLILFVWSAAKHAVLRAFDGVRQKLEYVQGTGPASIVLAAERWVAARPA
jgi:hypothetical protein